MARLLTPEIINNCILDIDTKSSHDFEKIITELNFLRNKHLEIRIYDTISLEILRSLLMKLEPSTLRSINIYIKYSLEILQYDTQQQLFSITNRLVNIVVHSCPQQYISENEKIFFTTEKINNASHCGIIHQSYFDVNQTLFTESQRFNNCLNQKIAIDTKGYILRTALLSQ